MGCFFIENIEKIWDFFPPIKRRLNFLAVFSVQAKRLELEKTLHEKIFQIVRKYGFQLSFFFKMLGLQDI
jgi:hypothetical protein